MLTSCVTLRERLHRRGDLGAGGDRRSCRILVRVCRPRRRCVRLLSGIRQLLRREVDDAIGTGAVQAAEDVQALVLAPVEVQTEDGGEDEQHHGKVKHNHNGRLGKEMQGGKQTITMREEIENRTQNYSHTAPAGEILDFF